MKFKSTYQRPDIETLIENRTLKTFTREIFLDSDIGDVVNQDFVTLMLEEDVTRVKE